MWLCIAAQYPVVKMMGDLVWWRVHPGQEYRQGNDSLAYAFLNFRIAIEALANPACPLSNVERNKAIHRVKYGQARLVWRLALRERHLRAAVHLYRDSGLSARELARGLGRVAE